MRRFARRPKNVLPPTLLDAYNAYIVSYTNNNKPANPKNVPEFDRLTAELTNQSSFVHNRLINYMCKGLSNSDLRKYPIACLTVMDSCKLYRKFTRVKQMRIISILSKCDVNIRNNFRQTISKYVDDMELFDMIIRDQVAPNIIPRHLQPPAENDRRRGAPHSPRQQQQKEKEPLQPVNNANLLFSEMCHTTRCLDKIVDFCKVNNIRPTSETIGEIYSNHSIRWDEVHLYIEELLKAGMIVDDKVLFGYNDRSLSDDQKKYCVNLFVKNIVFSDNKTLTLFIENIFTFFEPDKCVELVLNLIAGGILPTDINTVLDAIKLIDDNIITKVVMTKSILDMKIDYKLVSDSVCKSGNYYTFNKMIEYGTFVVTENSFNFACTAGCKDIVEKLIDMRVQPTSDCFDGMSYSLLIDESFLDFLFSSGLEIDIKCYNKLKTYPHFDKYNYTDDKVSYLHFKEHGTLICNAHRCNNHTSLTNSIRCCELWNRDLYDFRIKFAKAGSIFGVNDLEKSILLTNFVPDQFCYDLLFLKFNLALLHKIKSDDFDDMTTIEKRSAEILLYLEDGHLLKPTELTFKLYEKIYPNFDKSVLNYYKNIKSGCSDDYTKNPNADYIYNHIKQTNSNKTQKEKDDESTLKNVIIENLTKTKKEKIEKIKKKSTQPKKIKKANEELF